MKAFKVKYHHGHFIDQATNKRIVPVQGAEYIITGAGSGFCEEDEKLNDAKPLNADEKAKWMQDEFGTGRFKKIADTNTKLFFRIGNSRSVKGDESHEYIFTCILLEDLYLFKIDGRDGKAAEDWRLADCVCVLNDCILGGLSLSEKIVAASLNRLFTHTVMFYFNMQRSGACNAFSTFFIYEPDLQISFSSIKSGMHEGLQTLRKKHVKI